MANLASRLIGNLNYPVQNRTCAYTLGCDIAYDMAAPLEITDHAKYEAAKDTLKAFLNGNMPDYLKEALAETVGSPLPMAALSRSLSSVEEALMTVTEGPLEAFGVKPVRYHIISFSPDEASLKLLTAKEDPEAWARLIEDAQKNILIDECMKPEKMAPFFFPASPAVSSSAPLQTVPWNCALCGRKSNTSKFCPECGTPCPERQK